MELPSWFLVFIILGVIALVLVVLIAINPSFRKLDEANKTSLIVSACLEWAKTGCTDITYNLTVAGGAEVNDVLNCNSKDMCRGICQQYGVCEE